MRFFFLFLLGSTVSVFGQDNDALKRARLLYDQEQFAQAISLLNEVIDENSGAFEAYLLRGDCFQKEEKFVAALQSYEKADALNSKSALLNANQGAAFLNLKQFEEANKKLKKALKLDPDLPEAHYFMGNLLYFDYRTQAAVRHYSKAISLRPSYRDALYMRAAAYTEMERYDLALRDYQTVLELDPTLSVAKFNTAIIFVLNEQYQEALEVLSEINPDDLPTPKDYYFYQGEALYFTDRKEEACEGYEKAAEMGDDEAREIYMSYCINNLEREKEQEKRVIRMAF